MTDYWDYLKDFVEKYFSPAKGQSYSPYADYYTDTHPSESQFKKQQLFGILFPRYAAYMKAKSQDEYNDILRKMYDIDFDDITYPWLSNILSGNSEQVVASGAWDFSRNIWKLYK